MDPLATVVIAIWVALPAYIPNNIAVVAGGGAPIDGGRHWRGGRLLGDGKTWRGTVAGILGGMIVALLLNQINETISTATGLALPTFSVGIILAFPVGALLGDIIASFLKRRTGRERGSAFPIVDQLDFLVVALGLGIVLDPAWMREIFSPLILGVVVVLTPLLHVVTNIGAYLLGLKREPW